VGKGILIAFLSHINMGDMYKTIGY